MYFHFDKNKGSHEAAHFLCQTFCFTIDAKNDVTATGYVQMSNQALCVKNLAPHEIRRHDNFMANNSAYYLASY